MTYLSLFHQIESEFEKKKEIIKDAASLKTLLIKYTFNLDDYKNDLIYPEDLPYGRKILFQSKNFEAILMNWKPGNESNIHNHGESFGCVFVLKGIVINNLFDEHTKIKNIFLFQPGDISEVNKGIFHQIKNTTKEYAVTMHFYAPPIKNMTVIDKNDLDKNYIVKCNSGAWNPKPDDIEKTIIHKKL